MGYPVGKSVMKMNRNLAQRRSLTKFKKRGLKHKTSQVGKEFKKA